MEKKVYTKDVGCDQIYNFVVEKIFIGDRYSCEMGYIKYLKVMIKGKYLIVGRMWWCSPVVEKDMREAEVVGSNPGTVKKYTMHIHAEKESIFFIFIHIGNIYFNM